MIVLLNNVYNCELLFARAVDYHTNNNGYDQKNEATRRAGNRNDSLLCQFTLYIRPKICVLFRSYEKTRRSCLLNFF